MSTHDQPHPVRRPSCHRMRSRRGFSLVELAVVGVILGLLLAIAVPAFNRITERTENTRFIHDLRIYSQAFETYALSMGEWPADTAPSVLPAGVEVDLRQFPWDSRNTIGGVWKWDHATGDGRAGIATVGSDIDVVQIQQIDAEIDDGNLASGLLRSRGGGGYVYLLEF